MKRSELKRKTPLSSTKPASTRRKRAKRQPVSDKRWRSPEYLEWIRQRPCAFCALGPCDPHHVIGLGWGLSGMGLTAPDSYAMPLCRVHHDRVHANPDLQRAQVDWLRWTIRAALEARNVDLGDGARDELVHALAFVEAKTEEMA